MFLKHYQYYEGIFKITKVLSAVRYKTLSALPVFALALPTLYLR